MTILEWGALGAIMLAIVIFCARLMKRGLVSLDDDRRKYLEKIKSEERQLAEEHKNIAALEHLDVMRAALEDLLRLENNPAGHRIVCNGRVMELVTPEGSWRIELVMREKNLKSAHKTLHGRSRWLLSGFGHNEEHPDPASLMKSLNSHLRNEEDFLAEPEHLSRRLCGINSIAQNLRH